MFATIVVRPQQDLVHPIWSIFYPRSSAATPFQASQRHPLPRSHIDSYGRLLLSIGFRKRLAATCWIRPFFWSGDGLLGSLTGRVSRRFACGAFAEPWEIQLFISILFGGKSQAIWLWIKTLKIVFERGAPGKLVCARVHSVMDGQVIPIESCITAQI